MPQKYLCICRPWPGPIPATGRRKACQGMPTPVLLREIRPKGPSPGRDSVVPIFKMEKRDAPCFRWPDPSGSAFGKNVATYLGKPLRRGSQAARAGSRRRVRRFLPDLLLHKTQGKAVALANGAVFVAVHVFHAVARWQRPDAFGVILGVFGVGVGF